MPDRNNSPIPSLLLEHPTLHPGREHPWAQLGVRGGKVQLANAQESTAPVRDGALTAAAEGSACGQGSNAGVETHCSTLAKQGVPERAGL